MINIEYDKYLINIIKVMNNIYIVDKPAGMTSKDFADKIKEKEKLRKICFCGRLDPMARGKMILLGDEMCKKMDSFLKTEKTYQFEICFGVSTDSDDPLGIIQSHVKDFDHNLIYDRIINYIDNMDITINQEFHKYSSIRVNGKPLWLHSMENSKVEKPKHQVSIKNFKVMKRIVRDFDIFKNNIIRTINCIPDKHTFRQNETINQWNNFYFDKIYSLKLEICVTSGFYVRQFVRDMSKALDFPLMVYDINRIKII